MGDHDWYELYSYTKGPPGPAPGFWLRFKRTLIAPMLEFGGWIALFLFGLFLLNLILSIST